MEKGEGSSSVAMLVDDVEKLGVNESRDGFIEMTRFTNVALLDPMHQSNVGICVSWLTVKWEVGGKLGGINLPYDNIRGLFCLLKPRRPCMYVVVCIDPSIDGEKALPEQLVFQFRSYHEVHKVLKMEEKVKHMLTVSGKKPERDEYKGVTGQVFADILYAMCDRERIMKDTMLKDAPFSEERYGVDACLKGGEGHLYPLNNCFMFVPSPLVIIKDEEIEYVSFTENTKGSHELFFDVLFKTKTKQLHLFQAIANYERNNFTNLLGSRGFKLQTSGRFEVEKGGQDGRVTSKSSRNQDIM